MNAMHREITDDNSFISVGHLSEPMFYKFIDAAYIIISNIFMLRKHY
jgi:hypothetical protein